MDICEKNEIKSELTLNANFDPSPKDFIISENFSGLCIILNFEQYDHFPTRRGSSNDVDYLKHTFEILHCKIELHSNYDKNETLSIFHRISQADYSKYRCIVVCILSYGQYGKILCRDGKPIETHKLMNLVAENVSLRRKPKLFIIGSSQACPVDNQSEEVEKLFRHSEIFIFFCACPGQYAIRSITKGTWFIQELCHTMILYIRHGYDLLRIATLVIKKVAKRSANIRQLRYSRYYENNEFKQNPIFHSALTESFVFNSVPTRILKKKKKDPQEESFQLLPELCRLLILNSSEQIDITSLQSAYDLENYIKSYNCEFLKYNFNDICAREYRNSTDNCNSLVFLLLSKQLQTTFLTNGIKRFPTLADVSTYFNQTNCPEEIQQLSKYYFINSSFATGISSTNEQIFSANFYYFKSGGQTFVSCNAFPVNHTAQMLSCYNYPKSIPLDYCTFLPNDVQELNNDNAKLSFNQLLMSHLSNTIKFDNFDCIANLEHTNFKELVYDTRGVTAGTVVMLYHAEDSDAEKEYDRHQGKLKNLFKFELKFNFQNNQTEQMNIFDSNFPLLIMNLIFLAIKDAKNCIILFIFAECKNDESQRNSLELIFEQNRKICFTALIDYLKMDDLVGKPKLIFIQNLNNNDIKMDFDLPEDFLILISPAKFKSNFVEQFCNLMNEHYSEYDLMSILHKLNIFQGKLQYSIKSTLTKTLFFKKPQTKLDFEIIKNDDLFYRQDKGGYRFHIMRYVKECDMEKGAGNETTVEEALKERFEKLNFETSIQKFNNDSLKRMLDNEMLQNHYAYDGFFVIMILDEETDSQLIIELFEHLTSVESLVGKPKVLFLLGPMDYKSANLTFARGIVETYTTDFRLSKHADLMVFQSAEFEKTINSICANFTEDNVNQFDLFRLLMMVSSDVNSDDQQAVDLLKENSKNQNSENQNLEIQNQPNLKKCQSQICQTNSTLTRLVSFKTNTTISSPELLSKLQACEFKLKSGKCYIFNYEFFKNPKNNRPGSEEDQRKLIKTFKGMGFVVEEPVPDMPVAETNNVVDKINCEGYECLVVCFLTHGNANNDIQCKDGFVNQNEVINRIAARPDMNGKPKFFISQTCRGDYRETSDPSSNMSTDILTPTDSPLAIYPDLFLFYPTFESHVSHRDNLKGTWFIQELCNQLIQNSHQYDIFTIAAIVTRKVSRENENWSGTLFKQTPTFYSTLKYAYSFPKVSIVSL